MNLFSIADWVVFGLHVLLTAAFNHALFTQRAQAGYPLKSLLRAGAHEQLGFMVGDMQLAVIRLTANLTLVFYLIAIWMIALPECRKVNIIWIDTVMWYFNDQFVLRRAYFLSWSEKRRPYFPPSMPLVLALLAIILLSVTMVSYTFN